ncbi:MAG: hypothetical protein WB682_09910 [Candidatus Dormiibacterota bacterium]
MSVTIDVIANPTSNADDRGWLQRLHRGGALTSAAALFFYALLAVLLFANVWASPAGSWIGDSKDPKLFIWYLGWIPHALSSGQNPLITDYMAYPPGVNLMWNTSLLFPAFILWPITAAFGPVVAYNVLVTAGVAVSAWFGYLAARRFFDDQLLCVLVGLVYGFSPGLLAQATRHPHAMIALFPPIAVLLADEILVRQRFGPVLIGAVAGVAAALQLLTGEELLATTALVGAIGVALLALMFRHAVAGKLPYALRAAAAAIISFGILSAYPLAVQFLGPQRVFGDVQPPDVYVTDLLAFLVPNHALLQNGATAYVVEHFTGNASEDDAYVGLPLLVLFVAGLKLNWRRPAIRWAGLLALITALLSLGPRLHVFGHATPLWLPWAALAKLPLMGGALPGRFMVIAFLGIGIVVASVWMTPIRGKRSWRFAAPLVLTAGLLTMVPQLPFANTPSTLPSFFRPGGGVQNIADGAVVLVTPFASKQSTDAMYWQAASGYRFRMPEGDAFTPGPYLGPHPSYLETTLEQIDQGVHVSASATARFQALHDLSAFGVQTIVAGPSSGRDSIVEFLTAVVGALPDQVGGVDVWWHVSPVAGNPLSVPKTSSPAG